MTLNENVCVYPNQIYIKHTIWSAWLSAMIMNADVVWWILNLFLTLHYELSRNTISFRKIKQL